MTKKDLNTPLEAVTAEDVPDAAGAEPVLTAPTPITPKAERERFELSDEAKELFERESGLRQALQFLGENMGRINKKAWDMVFKEHPQLEGQFGVYDEKQGNVYVIPDDEVKASLKAGIDPTIE